MKNTKEQTAKTQKHREKKSHLFITSGGLRVDYLITHDGIPHVGLVGGNGVYAAVGAALWHDDIGIWVRMGANYPQKWVEALQQSNFKTDGLVWIAGEQDHRTFFAYTADGRRDDLNPAAHFERIGHPFPDGLQGYIHSALGQENPHIYEPLALQPQDWPSGYEGATAVHLSPLSLATHLNVPAMLRQRGVGQISCDPGERYMVAGKRPFIQQLLPQIDVFLPSNKEIRSLFGEDADLWEAANTLCQWGAPLVIIKNGADGVLIQEGVNGRQTAIPAFHTPNDARVIDITGAGDSFCGGFMVGLAQTHDPVQAAKMGVVSSSLVIEGYGALYALGRKSEGNGRLVMIQ